MDSFDNLSDRYPIQKTLRFSLLLCAETSQWLEHDRIVEKAAAKEERIKRVKGYIDEYHRHFIEKTISECSPLFDYDEYAEHYLAKRHPKDVKKRMEELEGKMRSDAAKVFCEQKVYPALFKKTLIRELLPEFLTDENKLRDIEEFYAFTTIFTSFNEHRRRLYSDAPTVDTVAFRTVRNLKFFLDNVKTYNRVKTDVYENIPDRLPDDIDYLFSLLDEVFKPEAFFKFASPSGITYYNRIIRTQMFDEYPTSKGFNAVINEYNTAYSRRIPKLKVLSMLPLFDDGIVSLDLSISSGEELVEKIIWFTSYGDGLIAGCDNVLEFFNTLPELDFEKIFVSRTYLSVVSVEGYGSPNAFKTDWEKYYDSEHPDICDGSEKYMAKRRNAFLKEKGFSLALIEKIIRTYRNPEADATRTMRRHAVEYTDAVKASYEELAQLNEQSTRSDIINSIKVFFEAVKKLYSFLQAFVCSGTSFERDEYFYGELMYCNERFEGFEKLYHAVRNFITRRQFFEEQIKIDFNNPYFLSGWDRNKEKKNAGQIFIKDGEYYLGVVPQDRPFAAEFAPFKCDDGEYFEKMEYKQLQSAQKMLPKVIFAKSNEELFHPPADILTIYSSKTYTKGSGFSLADCRKLIDFYKASIPKYPEWRDFEFNFSDTSEYKHIGDFFREVEMQAYFLRLNRVSAAAVYNLVKKGRLYLFKLHTKDLSGNGGRPNLHTQYFKMLFDERNLEKSVFKLCGGAFVFFRKAFIDEEHKSVIPAGTPVKNKIPLYGKEESVFDYDIVRDARYTEPGYFLHLPIELNYSSPDHTRSSFIVRRKIKESDNNYIIGIDRGERNLVYVCVLDPDGCIAEQFSLNVITSETDTLRSTDYKAILDEREAKRDSERKNWEQIESIKDLKSGYIGAAVKKICELVFKYNAIVALESLNGNFYNKRAKFETQVYARFESALIEKLSFYVDKTKAPAEPGGLLNAYQLVDRSEANNDLAYQNGIVFYVSSWFTSKICPLTGFAPLMTPTSVTITTSKRFIEKLEFVRYNKEAGYYEFLLNYDEFKGCISDFKKKWCLCSYGERIDYYLDKQTATYKHKTVDLTSSFRRLFSSNGVYSCGEDMRERLIKIENDEFYTEFIHLFALMMQLRNFDGENDYIVSPVRNEDGFFFDSRKCSPDSGLPCSSDANGAYNIARKAMWAVKAIKQAPNEHEMLRRKVYVSNKEWLRYSCCEPPKVRQDENGNFYYCR